MEPTHYGAAGRQAPARDLLAECIASIADHDFEFDRLELDDRMHRIPVDDCAELFYVTTSGTSSQGHDYQFASFDDWATGEQHSFSSLRRVVQPGSAR